MGAVSLGARVAEGPGSAPILAAAMPIYEYRCENGHTFEVMQRMTDDPVATCQTCSAPVQRVFHPVAVHFKGSGFYNTDYGTKRRSREMEQSAKDGADKHDAKAADKKKDTGSSAGTAKPGASDSTAKKSSGSD
jgi:putative FmdB family regulatory protein